MNHLLSPAHVERLARALRGHVLVAFDFDGTLAPIVSDRDAARMRARTSELFAKVCARYPCAVLSGRAQADVAARLEGAAVKYVVGNHGSEPHERMAQFAAELDDVRKHLATALHDCQGVEVEDKRYSLAIHYRAAADRAGMRKRIDAAVSGFAHRLRKIPGKLVLNLTPVQAPDKGDALLRVMALEAAEAVLYVGDDVTDEDVFRLDRPGTLLTVRVGEAQFSAAHYYLRDQQEIDQLLVELVGLRLSTTR